MPRIRVAVQHLRNGPVAEETGGQGHLEPQPVAGLADIEDVAGVGGAGYVEMVLVVGDGRGNGSMRVP